VTGSDGAVLLDKTVVLTEPVDVGGESYRAALVRLPDGRALTFWLPEGAEAGGGLLVFEPSTGDSVRVELAEGESAETAGLTIEFAALEDVPSALVPDFPLPASLREGSQGEALLQMTNVVFGTSDVSSGEAVETPQVSGEPTLTIVGLDAQPVMLQSGESAEVGGLEYTFEGPGEFAGINVKRDRSDMLVWVGAAAIVVGLMITFWVPRRRLWAKITATRASLAGQAPSHANFSRELAGLAREAGGQLTEEAEDDD
jgi:hypothetical protein